MREKGLSPLANAPVLTEQSKKQSDNKNATKNFDYIAITDRLRKDCWRNDSHPTCVGKSINMMPTFSPTNKAV